MNYPIDNCPFCKRKLQELLSMDMDDSIVRQALGCDCDIDNLYNRDKYSIILENGSFKQLEFLYRDFIIKVDVNNNCTTFFHYNDDTKDVYIPSLANFDFSSFEKLNEKINLILTYI